MDLLVVLLSWGNIVDSQVLFEKNITYINMKILMQTKISIYQNIMHMGKKTYLILKQYPHALWALWYYFISKIFKIKDGNWAILN